MRTVVQDINFSLMWKIKDEQSNLVSSHSPLLFKLLLWESWGFSGLQGEVRAFVCMVSPMTSMIFLFRFSVQPHFGAFVASHVMFQEYF